MFILRSMLRFILAIWEFIRIVFRRLRTQGLKTTLQWLYAVGYPRITGRLPLRFSRITPKLYIGPQYGKRGRDILKQAGVNASMSLRAEYDDEEYGLSFPEYSYLPTIDNTAPSMEHLEEGVTFIQRIIREGGTVYVHCGSGVGRAPTLATAYLISEGYTLDDAITKIKAVRPFIRILPVQIDRLREYEAMLQDN